MAWGLAAVDLERGRGPREPARLALLVQGPVEGLEIEVHRVVQFFSEFPAVSTTLVHPGVATPVSAHMYLVPPTVPWARKL